MRRSTCPDWNASPVQSREPYESLDGFVGLEVPLPRGSALTCACVQRHCPRLGAFGLSLFALLGCRDAPPEIPLPEAPVVDAVGGVTLVGVDYAYFQRAWADAGRSWLARQGGVRWHAASERYVIDPAWPNVDQTGKKAYYLQYAASAGIHAAASCGDQSLRSELAAFFVAYLSRLTTLGALRAETDFDLGVLDDDAPASTRTLRWVQTTTRRTRLRECEVCNAQFFYAPAQLVRALAELEPSSRTDIEREFVAQYVPLLVREHLLRPDNDVFEPNPLRSVANVALGKPDRVTDRQLWMMATALEVLGAHRLDGRAVPLTTNERERLQTLAGETWRRFTDSARRHRVPGGVAISYFEGQFAEHADYRFAGVETPDAPDAEAAATVEDIGWDSGHYHRVAFALRSAWDNRAELGEDAPTRAELSAAARQFTTTIWNRDRVRPNAANYSTGHDGWYRLGYHGNAFGYPPSQHCDARDASRPCRMRMAALGWGVLSFVEPDLSAFYAALVALATSDGATQIEHRRRVLTQDGEEFATTTTTGEPSYPPLLLFVLGTIPEQLAGCQ